ncbi:MAG: VWA domain-containing protein [Candidatus Thiodiazotropha sp. (ex Lucinoma borealis)]|nr:VWA domain-containing protein [Candidatus Thiodiazotropha sp. (ex Lucinoma borealis)]
MKILTDIVTNNRFAISLGLLLSITSASFYVSADDVEIYLQEPPDPVPPNVLFVLDESGSMNTNNRRDNLVTAMETLINDPDMGNVNAALLGYTTRWGNDGPLYLRAHSGDFSIIDDNRSSFLTAVNNLQTVSYTPTVKAMEAAVNWFRRDQTFTDFNNFVTTSPIAGDPEDNWCRPNHMVVLTDGRPNSNSSTSGQAYGLTSYEGSNCTSDSTSSWQNGRCAREIAAWAYTTDLEEGTGWHEQQNIVTHTIGFDTNDTTIQNFMTSIANAGGGNYYPANNVSQLVAAFTSIVTDAIESIPYAYTAPVIPFNQDNSAVSGDRIFVPMFVPAAEKLWKGNIKSYTITTSTTAGEISIVLEDSLGQPIVDPNTNQFVSSTDHWSSSSDGADPLVGGAAAHFVTATSRNLYTNINPGAALSDSTNHVHRDNNLVTEGMLGVATSALRTDLLNWISWDPAWVPATPEDESHVGVMGAPLHTQPAVQPYSTGDVIYLLTTEGVLEAIDEETGEELWAFMPTDLLPEILTISNNDESSTPYYGLDGPLTLYETGGRKMAAFGMRRGGRHYYILDITNRLAPEHVTTISNTTLGFEKLGQTWSKPIFASMEIEGATAQDVLVFGGGYDPSQDTTTTRVDDNEGNAIFIVSASDGLRLKTISNSAADLVISDMDNAIAGDLLPVDINTNGITDRLYGADVGGRIIRIDIPDSDFASTTLSGGIIADINDSSTEFRRFFNTPEVGYFNRGGNQFLAILIGTGNRPAPLDSNVTDRFYMLKDYAVWTAPGTYITSTQADLYDASDNLIQDGSSAEMLQANTDLLSTRGWYIDFRTAEKSLSKAILYNYAVLFTTYSAERSSDLAACEARGAVGVSRFYSIDMIDASAKFDGLGGNAGTLDINDRSKVLSILGMPPSPSLVFPGGQNGMVGQVVKALVGLEEVYEWPDRFIPISWEEVIE